MTRPSEHPDEAPVTRAEVAVAMFWTMLGALGFIIATVIGVSIYGYIGPAAALIYGIYDGNRLRKRALRARAS